MAFLSLFSVVPVFINSQPLEKLCCSKHSEYLRIFFFLLESPYNDSKGDNHVQVRHRSKEVNLESTVCSDLC